MTFDDVFNVCRARGVRLVIQGGQLRAQGRPGAVNEPLKQGLVEHKAQIVDAFGDGIWPDETLPDETLPDVIVIPAATPNTESAIKAVIDAQRR
jgi:AmiR/NasT family two-component response regulator